MDYDIMVLWKDYLFTNKKTRILIHQLKKMRTNVLHTSPTFNMLLVDLRQGLKNMRKLLLPEVAIETTTQIKNLYMIDYKTST